MFCIRFYFYTFYILFQPLAATQNKDVLHFIIFANGTTGIGGDYEITFVRVCACLSVCVHFAWQRYAL